jgi:LysM repeat protein
LAENGLQPGQVINVTNPKSFQIEKVINDKKTETSENIKKGTSENVADLNDSLKYQQYTIMPRETLYGLSKKFNVSQMRILELNPILNESFKEGLTINLPNTKLEEIQQNTNKTNLIAKKSSKEKT